MLQDLSLPIGEDESIYQLFYDNGFYSDSWGTILVDIDTTKSKEELWNNLEKKRRNSVNKGKRQGLEGQVKEAKSEEDYDKVITMIEEMSIKNKIFAHPRKYYHVLFKILGEKGMLKTFFIEKDGHGVATLSLYLFGKRAIQTLVAQTDYIIKEKISGTDFLEWETIKWCHDNGYETYDLAGIRPDSTYSKDIGIRNYKMHWGGQVVKYLYFSKVYSKTKEKLADLMRKIYKK
jgi:lipid II:glycine glycyltransferase (peptidoglycan interpeptide bridge formation enzyme)